MALQRIPKAQRIGFLDFYWREGDERTPAYREGYFTGECDTWGKRTFVVLDGGPSPLYLFSDELIDWEDGGETADERRTRGEHEACARLDAAGERITSTAVGPLRAFALAVFSILDDKKRGAYTAGDIADALHREIGVSVP